MAQSSQARTQIKFGPFATDLHTRELFRGGTRIKLQDRPFDILAMLLERPGDVVTREEMRARLWPDGTFVDFDNNISSAMGKLRAALGDSASEPRYIETASHGYRFVGHVTFAGVAGSAGTSAAETANLESPAARIDTQGPPKQTRRKWLWASLAVGLVATIASVAYTQWRRTERLQSHARIMLAVLPFENLIGDNGQEYFSDGMTQEMITQLGGLDPQHLGVIARTSVMRYKNSHTSLPQIGRELGVQYVLEGSVRRQGDYVRVNAQLIDVRDQTHLWAREYQREMKELLAVQTEIAQQIAAGIQPALGNTRSQSTVFQPAMSMNELTAYDLYLQGQYYLAKRSAPNLQRARDLFQQAIEKNPNFARSWAGLAVTYTLIGGYSGVSPTDDPEKARAAARRALAIDERLPEAHTALALIVQNYDWDWQTAEKEFRRAIELSPNDVTAHHWYAEHLMWRGRFDEALKESEQARQLDPLSLIVTADNGAIYYYSRHFDLAIQRFHEVLELDPNFPRAAMICYAYTEKGRFSEAISFISNTPPENPWHWSDLAYIQARAGRISQARESLQQIEPAWRIKEIDPAVFVRPYIAIGDKDQAIASLKRAYAARSNTMIMLNVDPAFDPIRSDPRFQNLVRLVGLSP